jgi:AraC family transcriptional regulator, alkane utilization regulator
MDALSEVLRLVRLTGAVFLDAELSAPWAVQSPPSHVLAQAMMPEADHMIEYHLVVEGHCFIKVADEPPIKLEQGDLVMVPRGDSHRMSSDLQPAVPVLRPSELKYPAAGEVATPRYGGGGGVTRLVCGYLAIDQRLCAALIGALPRVFRVSAGSSEVSAWLQTYLRIRVIERGEEQPGGACVLAKLSELMFVEAVRRYVESLPANQSGWLSGLKDPYVGKVLGLMHGSPTRSWTVESLAREVGLSRSALADRFTALLGKSPMQYLTHWRLTLAAHLLRTTNKSASVVAFEVGYESEAAFNRAFRRAFGAPPAAWRRGDAGSTGTPNAAASDAATVERPRSPDPSRVSLNTATNS